MIGKAIAAPSGVMGAAGSDTGDLRVGGHLGQKFGQKEQRAL